MRAAFIVLSTVFVLDMSCELALGSPIRVCVEGAIAAALTPDQYEGSMALPKTALGGIAKLQLRVAPAWWCSLEEGFFRIGAGSLAPGWGSIPENRYTTEPSSLFTSLLCLRFEPAQERATLYAFGGAGIGRWKLGDEQILSMLEPYRSTAPGHTETVPGWAIGGGLRGHTRPIAPSAMLQWILVSTKDGPVSIVPLSVGVTF